MVLRPGWLTRPVLAWALYDVASSTFAALVPVFFGLFFVTVVAVDLPGAQGRWGASPRSPFSLRGALAPFYGAWADRRARLLALLAAATALCVIATVAMPIAGRGDVLLAAVLFVAAQVGYTLGAALYDSLLVRIAPRTHVGRVSGFGWTIGFAGGIVALLAALGLMHGVPVDAQAERLSDTFWSRDCSSRRSLSRRCWVCADWVRWHPGVANPVPPESQRTPPSSKRSAIGDVTARSSAS